MDDFFAIFSQGLVHNLRYLLKRRKSKASAADMEKFVAEHSRAKFRSDLVKFFSSALPKFKSFSLYSVRKLHVAMYIHMTCRVLGDPPFFDRVSRTICPKLTVILS